MTSCSQNRHATGLRYISDKFFFLIEGSRIRTCDGITQQIYNLPLLAAQSSLRILVDFYLKSF